MLTFPSIVSTRRNRLETIFHCIETQNIKELKLLFLAYQYTDTLSLTTSDGGSTILHHCIKHGNNEILEFLLSYPMNNVINSFEYKLIGGYAPIHYACLSNKADSLNLLINAGADVNIKSIGEMKETALHICCKSNFLECARILMQHGANPSLYDGFGHNPSFWAFSRRHFSLIKELGLPNPKSVSALEHFTLVIGAPKESILNYSTSKAKKSGAKNAKTEKGKKK